MQKPQAHTARLIVPLGMEDLALWELNRKFEYKGQLIQDAGGINTDATWEEVLAWNKSLRSLTRVLWRLEEFRCRDFPKLFSKIKNFDWSHWLTHPDIDIKTSAHQSRLIHSDRIAQTASEALKAYFKAYPAKKIIQDKSKEFPAPTLYVRLQDDFCQLSIDLSGDPLYIRGNDKESHHAPIRENLANTLITCLFTQTSGKHCWEELNWVLDPMCGSGTFLHEFFHFNHEINNRKFSWQGMPRQLKSPVENLPPAKTWISFSSNLQFYGRDIDNKALTESKRLCPFATIDKMDALCVNNVPHAFTGNGLILCNPPYGERLSLSHPRQIYFQQLYDAMVKNYSPKLIGIIIPQDITLKLSDGAKLLQTRAFFHGGLRLNFWMVSFF